MFERIFMDSEGTAPSVTDYDLIIADEALCETAGEQTYRNSPADEFHAVLDYFDAERIVMTVDSTRQVDKIFGKPVFTYSHRRAVEEGYLAD